MNARIDLSLIERIAAELAPYRDDEETYLDTLDGETDALLIMDRQIAAEQADRALAAAIKAHEADLKARRDRIEARADARRRVLHLVLNATGLRKAERPLATLSIRAGGVSCVITDESAIPSQLCKVVTSPDKAAIKAQLEAGETVPGAELVRGPDSLSVRVR